MKQHEEYIEKYLDGRLDQDEMKTFEFWLRESPANKDIFVEMVQMDSLLSSAAWRGKANPLALEQIAISLGLAGTELKMRQMKILDGVRRHIYSSERRPVPVPLMIRLNWRIILPAAASFILAAGLIMYQIMVSDIMNIRNRVPAGAMAHLDSDKTGKIMESLSFEKNSIAFKQDLSPLSISMGNLKKINKLKDDGNVQDTTDL